MKTKETSMTEQVLKNSIWIFALTVLNKFAGIIFMIILARFLLPEKFGAYSLVLSVAIIFMSFGDLGINKTFTVLFSKTFKENKSQARSYFSFLAKLKFFLLLLVSIILILSSYFIAKYIFNLPELTNLFLIAAAYIFFFSLSRFFTTFFYIYKRVDIDFKKEIFFQLIRFALIIIVFVYLTPEYYLIGVFLSLVFSAMFLLIFTLRFYKKPDPNLFSRPKIKIDKKRIFDLLSYLIVIGILMVIFTEIDIIMLGIFVKDLKFLGFYKAAITLVLGTTGFLGITGILLPIFSSFKKLRLKRAFDKVIKYTFLLSIPASFGILVLGGFFLKALYGAEYIQGALIISFLAFLVFSETTSSLFNVLFSSREKPKFIAKSLLYTTIVNIILNYFLITTLLKVSLLWATSGAAIATLTSRFLFMLSLVFYSKKELKISIRKKHLIKPFISSIIMALVLYAIISSMEITLIPGIFLVILGILLYFLIMFIIKGITKEDILLLNHLRPKFLSKEPKNK